MEGLLLGSSDGVLGSCVGLVFERSIYKGYYEGQQKSHNPSIFCHYHISTAR